MKVQSSLISSVDYREETEVLIVEFNSGDK